MRYLLLKCVVVHKDDMIADRILTYEPNLLAQLERADQVVYRTYKNWYEIYPLKKLRPVHPLLTWFNHDG